MVLCKPALLFHILAVFVEGKSRLAFHSINLIPLKDFIVRHKVHTSILAGRLSMPFFIKIVLSNELLNVRLLKTL